jgi:drug/metabolite transporter (DMT)-like permease
MPSPLVIRMPYRQNILAGALLIVASELLFATMGAAVKFAAATLNNEVIVFMRNAMGLLMILPIVQRHGGLPALATRVPHLHLLRAVAGVAAMYCFFYTLGHLPIANGVLLQMTSPVFIPVLVFLWLKEPPGRFALLAVPIGFFGVMLVLDPGGELNLASLIGLLGGMLGAVAKVTVRRLTRTEPATRIVFYFAILSTAISALPMPWAWQTPTQAGFFLLLLIGMTGTAGQFLLTLGYGAAPAARVGPFTYFSVVFAAAYGYLFWEDLLTPRFAGGALLIAIAGMLALRSQALLTPVPGKNPEADPAL